MSAVCRGKHLLVEVGYALIAKTAVLRLGAHLRLADVAELILDDMLVSGAVKLARFQGSLVIAQNVIVNRIHTGSNNIKHKVHRVDGQIKADQRENYGGVGKIWHQQEKVDQAKEEVERPADDLEKVNWPTPAIVAHV